MASLRPGLRLMYVGRRSAITGLYQLLDTQIEAADALADAAVVPKGLICLTSALQYHELTLQMPSPVWMAIDRTPSAPRSIIRLSSSYASRGPLSARASNGIPSSALRSRIRRSIVDLLPLSDESQPRWCDGVAPAARGHKRRPLDIREIAQALVDHGTLCRSDCA